MKINTKRPFELAKIEIFEMFEFDIITVSLPLIGGDPFEGEDEEF